MWIKKISSSNLFYSVGAAKVNDLAPYDLSLNKAGLEFCLSWETILGVRCNKFGKIARCQLVHKLVGQK